MSKNYKGYFRSKFEDTLYEVRIIGNTGSTEYTEVDMGGEPFKVTYDTSENLFDPVRKSRATMEFVYHEYLFDVFSPYPNGTRVQLIKHNSDGTESVEWCGYLKPNMYDQDYENCFETFELEASDCLSLLQYYTYPSGTKQVVTFATVIKRLMDKMECLDGYYFARTKKIGDSWLTLGDIVISEQNFFSSDTDEPWDLEEVLEEVCKYLGVTCFEYQNYLYFMDYQWLAQNDNIPMAFYKRNSSGEVVYQGLSTIGGLYTIKDGTYMGNGATISMDTIYNKATVNCSIYDIEDLIPDMWDDDSLDNRYGDWTKCSYVPAFGKKEYINRKGKDVYEDTDDRYQVYVHRILDHDNYTSHYYNPNNMAEVSLGNVKVVVLETSEYNPWVSSHIVSITNNDTVSHSVVIYCTSEARWDAWTTDNIPYDTNTESYVSDAITVAAGESTDLQFQCIATKPTGVTADMSYSISYVLDNDGIELSEGKHDSVNEDKFYVGGTIIDLASFERLPTNTYNFEPTPSLSFSRYLCINQYNKPNGRDFGLSWTADGQMIYSPPDLTLHPCVYSLNKGFTRPVVWSDGTYIAINGKALCTRYLCLNYINKKWTTDATGVNGGIFSRDNEVSSRNLSLVFKLGIGSYFWNGTGWTTDEVCFEVPMSTSIDDDSDTEENENDVDFNKMWNTEFHVLNNFSWEEWTGAEGYRIPINNSHIDPNGEITFEVHLPVKIQYYDTDNTSKQRVANASLNGYVWVSDLEVTVNNVGKNKDDDEDIVYTNIIDADSINELDEIDLKINTNPDRGPLSYSFVGLKNGGYLKTITEPALSNIPQKPEENLIEKLVSQYSTPTKKENVTLQISAAPFTCYYDQYWGKGVFAQLGTEIDYAMDRQTMTIIELKTTSSDEPSTYLEVNPDTIYLDDTGSKADSEFEVVTNGYWTITEIEE